MTCGKAGHPSFFVRGLPVTQGSARGFVKGGRVIITSTSKGLGPWRRLIADQAQAHAPPMPWDGPVAIQLIFYLPRPKSEPRTRRTFPIRRPDADKLIRSVFDALTHVMWADDSQVTHVFAEKRWADDPLEAKADRRPPGVRIAISMPPTGFGYREEPLEAIRSSLTPRQLMDEVRKAMP